MPLSSHQDIQILHVDDDPSITDLTGTFLEREDDRFAVQTATSADEGLENINDRPPDCVVSDYNMPGTDGIEFLQAVREEYPDLPFILFTGEGSETVASDAIAAGVTDYLQKGSGTERYELLANRIRNAVRARGEAERADRQEQLMRLTEFAGDTGGFEFDRESNTILLTAGTRRIIGRPDTSKSLLRKRSNCSARTTARAFSKHSTEPSETGEELHDRWRLQQDDGNERLLDITITPVVENGEVTKLRGSGNDITDRKERERELAAERRFIEQALDTLDDLFYVLDTDGSLRRWNNQVPETTGYADSELADMQAIELFPKDDRPTIADAIQTAVSGEPVTVEANLLTADGERLPYEFTGAQLIDADGNTTGIVGIGRNLTGNKNREYRALAEEYEALLETSGDAVFMLDVDTTGEDPAFEFARLSPGYETQTGISTEEVRGKTPQAVFGSERGAELEANYTRCVEQRAPISYREELNIAEDARIWETSLAPVIIDGDVIRIVGIARNVTDQVEREREIQTQNERLEEFTSVVSHDLRNPLSVAEGRLELIRDVCESDHIDDVAQALGRMDTLIEDMLTLAQEAEQIDETEVIGLANIVKSSWQTANTEQAVLEIETSQSVEGDRNRLQQLFENLYRNAVEHGGDGVTVSVGSMDDGFYVADTGPGIPESEREEVFEAGYSTNEDGTGFGLRIVEQIADAHGWEITVTESKGGGARFRNYRCPKS
ncbi:PAS domain S-box protein [Natronoarchaeum sp. GCM10025703]|uniref:PAS domain S-box protein n=1 Tax=Natronoarchaeum sp. GCM10025703 TaxID=3252685 RepID=UPI003613C8F3